MLGLTIVNISSRQFQSQELTVSFMETASFSY